MTVSRSNRLGNKGIAGSLVHKYRDRGIDSCVVRCCFSAPSFLNGQNSHLSMFAIPATMTAIMCCPNLNALWCGSSNGSLVFMSPTDDGDTGTSKRLISCAFWMCEWNWPNTDRDKSLSAQKLKKSEDWQKYLMFEQVSENISMNWCCKNVHMDNITIIILAE
jgi:hypothetical protein